MKISNNSKKAMIFIAIIVGISFIAFSSYAILSAGATGETTIPTAKFQFTLNNSTNTTQNITLKDTLTANNYSDELVVPGTNGQFDLVFDLTNVEVSVNFIVNFDRTNLPTNLKLYSDSAYQNEITSINNTFNIGDSTTKTITVYWKWNYLTDDDSNANDNLFMNEDISLPTSIIVSQIVGGGN